MSSARSSRGSSFFAAVLLGILLGILALGLYSRRATTGFWNAVAARITGRELAFNTTMPTVVASIQRLARLETVDYTMDKIVEGDRESDYLPSFLAGDKLLLVVHGQVLAGVDLNQLSASDLTIHDRSITVQMPPAQLFLATLDNSKTHVYSRETGLLVSADPNLESQVRETAVAELKQAALDNGILSTAQANARATITTLLRGLGFQEINFR